MLSVNGEHTVIIELLIRKKSMKIPYVNMKMRIQTFSHNQPKYEYSSISIVITYTCIQIQYCTTNVATAFYVLEFN